MENAVVASIAAISITNSSCPMDWVGFDVTQYSYLAKIYPRRV